MKNIKILHITYKMKLTKFKAIALVSFAGRAAVSDADLSKTPSSDCKNTAYYPLNILTNENSSLKWLIKRNNNVFVMCK